MPTHKSCDYKLSTVKYYLSNSKNQVQTCKIFGCSERSLMRWVNKYKSTNHITRKKRDYISYKITNTHISFIKHQLKQNKTITEFLYHALGLCGEHSHPHLLNVGYIALFLYIGYKIVNKQIKTK